MPRFEVFSGICIFYNINSLGWKDVFHLRCVDTKSEAVVLVSRHIQHRRLPRPVSAISYAVSERLMIVLRYCITEF